MNGSSRRHGHHASVAGLRALGGLVVFVPAVAAVWLFLAAIPALADGGPHVSAINNGSLGINADSCAGCHRAHTAQGAMLLASAGDLCLTCHGTTGSGSTVDVENGIQYRLSRDGTAGTVLGALRGGGYVNARIGSGNAYRINPSGNLRTKVPVLGSGQAVTSAHIDLDGAGGVVATDTVWGNGAISSTAYAGTKITGLECTSCHNPHGNGNYRILNPIPDLSAEATGGTSFLKVAPPGALVTDAALPPAGDTRNYTVIQVAPGSGSLLASQVVGYGSLAGDYFHRRVPWYTAGSSDAPNGLASTFDDQITAWCAACHTRYYESNGDTDSGDAIFKFRHETIGNRACTTCHVAHGSNAQMTGVFSANQPLPGATSLPAEQVGNSRLLKIDNRGTCQACHDPTGTAEVDGSSGPVPVPYSP